jgi:hypothetical protein
VETTVAATGLTDDIRWTALNRKMQTVRAVEAFARFRAEGIEPVLIKGLAATLNYPENKPRMSMDMDLAVDGSDFAPARRIAEDLAPQGYAIDLHRELRHLDTVSWENLFANSHLIEFEGGSIRVLGPEDHLRVLSVHWLTNGGSDRERLWDIYFAIENRPDDFDWDRFLNVVGPNRRRWLVCAVGLAHKYLGLDISDTPLADEARNLPRWLTGVIEREWASDTHFVPLEVAMHDRKALLKQLPRRLRSDPIWATIQAEGSFDAPTRVHYQLANIFRRILPSYRRVSATFKAQQ